MLIHLKRKSQHQQDVVLTSLQRSNNVIWMLERHRLVFLDEKTYNIKKSRLLSEIRCQFKDVYKCFKNASQTYNE